MTEPIIRRVPCLSDGAIASLREDLEDAKDGEPMLLAWNYVAKALDEIAWLRAHATTLRTKLALQEGGIQGDALKALNEAPGLKARIAKLEAVMDRLNMAREHFVGVELDDGTK